MNAPARCLPLLLLASRTLPVAHGGEETFFPANHLIVVSKDTSSIFEFDAKGAFVREFGGDVGLESARGAAIGPDGRLYVTSESGKKVLVYDAGGDKVDEIEHAAMTMPNDVVFGADLRMYVTDFWSDKVLVFRGDSKEAELGAATTIDGPRGLIIGPNGNLFVCSTGNDKVHELTPEGKEVRTIGSPPALDSPSCLLFAPDGILYVGSYNTATVNKYDVSGAKVGEIAGFGDGVVDLAMATTGDLFLATEFNLVVISPAGGVITPPLAYSGVERARGASVAPAVLEGRLRGKLLRDGLKSLDVDEKVRVRVAPGSNQVSIMLPVDESKPESLAFQFSSAGFVFHGTEVVASDGAKTRTFRGVQIGPDALAKGVASTTLTLSGTAKGGFLCTKAVGEVSRSTASMIFKGKLTASKLLNP